MTPPRIPLELLFGNPEKTSPKISPDGLRLAYLAPDEGVLNIWAGPLSGPAQPVTKDRGRGIRSYLWAEDSKLLLYVQDQDGDENWHLLATDPATGETRDLTPFPGVQAQLVGTDPGFPGEVLVGLNRRDPRVHDVFRLDLRSGALTLEAENPGDVTGWLADRRFRVRCAKTARPDGGSDLRLLENGAWRTFLSWGPDDQGGAHGFTPDGHGLYVETSTDADTTELWEMPLDGSPGKRLARCDGADLGPVMLHPRDFRVQAAGFARERLAWTALDPGIAADLEQLAKTADGDFVVVSRDDADTIWIVHYDLDTRPPCYYLYDRTTGKTSFLFSARPALKGRSLAPMKAVTIRARDGLELPSYLTTPAGVEPRGLPLVLLVHGGPWARDGWGWDAEAQWLADRGIAALQVNFRGSTGFGKRFLHAGDREWGGKMQDDLTDAAAWAVAQGVADPTRVAVFGGSYGGYAALAGAAFTPDLYCCAVDIVGPSNIETLIRSIPPYWEPLKRIFDLRVGSVESEPGFLRARSPLFSVDKIKIPLLIAQGANDPRVKQAESEMIVSALREKGRPVEYLLYPDEGHGFARPENRLTFYAQAERFLERHLLRVAAPV